MNLLPDIYGLRDSLKRRKGGLSTKSLTEFNRLANKALDAKGEAQRLTADVERLEGEVRALERKVEREGDRADFAHAHAKAVAYRDALDMVTGRMGGQTILPTVELTSEKAGG